jgi:lysophospholipase L1-like esterase
LQAPAGLVENLAVPGARVVDALDKRPVPSQYETLVLGARTQVAALTALAPRFAIVDLGSEDVLQPVVNDSLGTGAAEPDLLNVGVFEARYSRVVDALAALPSLQGAVLVGAVDPVRYLPAWQVGAYYFLARDAATGRFRGVPVNTNCSPLTNLGQPNPLANNLVPISVTWSGAAEINCDPAATTHGLVTTAEQAVISARVAAYNATIQAAAAARNWAFVNPNTLLQAQSALSAAGRYQVIRRCQLLATAATPAQFQAAVLNSCPVTGPTAAPGGFYGSFFSTDGIHPATAGQALLAGAVAAAINARYGTTLPTTY